MPPRPGFSLLRHPFRLTSRPPSLSGLAAHGDSYESALKEVKAAVAESVKWLKEGQSKVETPTFR